MRKSNANTKQRDSNLELFRIVTMLLIIAHHYVANSGLMSVDGPLYSQPLSIPSIFLLIFGAWGKVGINCFVLLTGYFMCRSHITAKKFIKLLFEYMFYHVLIWVIFVFAGRETFSIRSFVKQLIPITYVGMSFTDAYLVFFLLIPFLNILISNMSEKQHMRLTAILFTVYSLMATVPFFTVRLNYISWFCFLYLVAAYIRLYPKKCFSNRKLWGGVLLATVIISIISIIGCTWFGARHESFDDIIATSWYFVYDSNKLLALLLSLSSFLFAKNIKMTYNSFVNTIAQSVFGVLLIHAHGNEMRRWLWGDVLNNVGIYGKSFMYTHAILSVLGVFFICVLLDQIRIRLLETPFFAFYDSYENQWRQAIYSMINKAKTKLRHRNDT